MDSLFRRLLEGLSKDEIHNSLHRWGELVSSCPELRLDLDGHAEDVAEVVRCLKKETGLATAIRRLCVACVTPTEVRRLRSRLYTIAARFADTHPDLVPAVALAALSLSGPRQAENPFVEMVVCASAVEQAGHRGRRHSSCDALAWLAAEPSAMLIGAVGEGRAYYYAAIPGVLLFLDRKRVLFDAEQLAPHVRLFQENDRRLLNRLVNDTYKDRLRGEIWRAWGTLRHRCPPGTLADAEMLFGRALESLDALPPSVNPLLQAIFVQSWVRYLETL